MVHMVVVVQVVVVILYIRYRDLQKNFSVLGCRVGEDESEQYCLLCYLFHPLIQELSSLVPLLPLLVPRGKYQLFCPYVTAGW